MKVAEQITRCPPHVCSYMYLSSPLGRANPQEQANLVNHPTFLSVNLLMFAQPARPSRTTSLTSHRPEVLPGSPRGSTYSHALPTSSHRGKLRCSTLLQQISLGPRGSRPGEPRTPGLASWAAALLGDGCSCTCERRGAFCFSLSLSLKYTTKCRSVSRAELRLPFQGCCCGC